MKSTVHFNVNENITKDKSGWKVRCPNCENYGFVSAETCHRCYIEAMALNNKNHRGHNCQEGLFYREQRANGYLL